MRVNFRVLIEHKHPNNIMHCELRNVGSEEKQYLSLFLFLLTKFKELPIFAAAATFERQNVNFHSTLMNILLDHCFKRTFQ